MAYRAYLQSQCATLPADDIISLCTAAIEASFSKDNKSHPPVAETLDAVHWYTHDSQQTRVTATQGCQLWSKVRQAYGKRTVDDCLASGRAFADETHLLNAQIQAAWPEGAYGAFDSQYHPGGIDPETLRLLAKASKNTALDIAKRHLAIIRQWRLCQEEGVTLNDTRLMILRAARQGYISEGTAEAIIAREGGSSSESKDAGVSWVYLQSRVLR